MIQANKFVGWPPSIPLNCEWQRIGLMANIGARGLVAIAYRSTLKYPNNKKDVDPNGMTPISEQVSGWVGESEHERILRNVPCHIMEYSKYIIFPRGIHVWCGKIFHALSWNMLPCHIHDLLGGINDLLTLNMLSFLVQPMLQMSKVLIKYF